MHFWNIILKKILTFPQCFTRIRADGQHCDYVNVFCCLTSHPFLEHWIPFSQKVGKIEIESQQKLSIWSQGGDKGGWCHNFLKTLSFIVMLPR